MPRRGGAASGPPFSQSVKSNDHPSRICGQSHLIKRKTLLERMLKPHPRLNYVDHVEGHGVGMYAGALALGLEGIVAKAQRSMRGRSAGNLALAEDQE